MRSFFLSALFFSTSVFCESTQDFLEKYIETVEDFPKKGISFKCFPKLLKDPEAFSKVISIFKEHYSLYDIDAICGIDSRGFIFGAALAYEMKLPFVMIRKGGKLPKETIKVNYSLEYGTSCLEMETDSLKKGDRVLVIDDLLATGGTCDAANLLCESLGAEVIEYAFLIELQALKGKERLKKPVFSIFSY